ncbi:MAG: hypothetical protein K8R74_10900 [Bacteroidales bacterium]|nr:hypothetical protein [Bacteroidales bacterium]
METLVILGIAAFFASLVGRRVESLNRNPWGWGIAAWLISPLGVWIVLEICGNKNEVYSCEEIEETTLE